MASIFSRLKEQISPAYLGIDIGTTSIKIVEVAQGKHAPLLKNYGILESSGHLVRANKVLQTSNLKLFEDEIVDLLRALLAEMRPATKLAVASLPSFSVFSTILDLPDMEPGELMKAMEFQARQYIPIPLSEVALDWLKIGEYIDDKGFKMQQVLLMSMPQEEIKRYRSIFSRAGLEFKVLEVETISLIRALIGADVSPTGIIDIGSRNTNILFAEDGQLRWSAQTDFASASLTQALASSLNVNPVRAEELKRERGIAGTGANYELSTIMIPFLDAILEEVKKAEGAYRARLPNVRKPERYILTGGGANLLGMQKYAEGVLGVPVVRSEILSRLEHNPEIEPLIPELNSLLTIASGLAMQPFSSV